MQSCDIIVFNKLLHLLSGTHPTFQTWVLRWWYMFWLQMYLLLFKDRQTLYTDYCLQDIFICVQKVALSIATSFLVRLTCGQISSCVSLFVRDYKLKGFYTIELRVELSFRGEKYVKLHKPIEIIKYLIETDYPYKLGI